MCFKIDGLSPGVWYARHAHFLSFLTGNGTGYAVGTYAVGESPQESEHWQKPMFDGKGLGDRCFVWVAPKPFIKSRQVFTFVRCISEPDHPVFFNVVTGRRVDPKKIRNENCPDLDNYLKQMSRTSAAQASRGLL